MHQLLAITYHRALRYTPAPGMIVRNRSLSFGVMFFIFLSFIFMPLCLLFCPHVFSPIKDPNGNKPPLYCSTESDVLAKSEFLSVCTGKWPWKIVSLLVQRTGKQLF